MSWFMMLQTQRGDSVKKNFNVAAPNFCMLQYIFLDVA
jgi:hypothetical protein